MKSTMSFFRHLDTKSWRALFCIFALSLQLISAQEQETEDPVPKDVEVESVTDDTKIAERLNQIFVATGWFYHVNVEVKEGIAFLNGQADNVEHREWATKLAQKTQDVVAVVNRMEIQSKGLLDFSPAFEELKGLGAEFVRSLPLIIAGLIMLIATWFAAKLTSMLSSSLFKVRLKSYVLADIASKTLATLVFLFGLYLVMRVSGLTRLALTILGSTGLLGLVIGFAFRDIAENFLASILISLQHPFAKNDLIEVAGIEGYVQNVNTRSTLLMTLEGNYVQIPNATIYKEKITNFTANPKTRFEFVIGVGYDNVIEEAQSLALEVLQDHPAVVDDPESLILVHELTSSTVNLRVIFWIDILKYSRLKVRSSVIRLVMEAFEDAGISMPDEAREIIFPQGVPIRQIEAGSIKEKVQKGKKKPERTHAAEGDLSSEAEEIQEQARLAREPEGETDLLEG